MLGVCYYPEHWPETLWAKDAKEMRELGLTYVRIAEFAWSRLEPAEGQFEFDWLDRAIDTLAAAGLKVIMCTPTATPPQWLVKKFPDMLAVDINTGLERGFGSRRHYDFSSTEYRDAAMKISELVAQRYGNHPAVVGWQTDNELACHDTTLSASDNALFGFRDWCRQRYGTIEKLNEAWGNVFWSMEYTDFEDIDVPYFAVTETNPSHSLAYRRYSSDQVVRFHDDMVAVIKKHSPDRFITHNFIPMSDTQTDNYALAKDLDFAAFDNYPLGRTDLFFADADTEQFKRYMRTGHPDFSSYYFDQTWGLCQTNYWIMEQQPGPVNWAVHNPRPEPGMVAFWSWVAFAHGAETVCYFRWRQAPFAQEQMHAGLKRVDNSPATAFAEVEQVSGLLNELGLDKQDGIPHEVAIVSTTTNQWVCEIEQQGQSFHHENIEFEYYSALRQLGVQVTFVSPDMSLDAFKLVIVPTMPIVEDGFIEHCKNTDAKIVFGPRSGSKTDEFQFAPNLAPGKLQQMINTKVLSVDTLRGDIVEPLTLAAEENDTFVSNRWREELFANELNSVAYYEDGSPAAVEQGKVTYMGTLMNMPTLKTFLQKMAANAGVETHVLPEDIRIAKRGNYGFVFNYSKHATPVDALAGEDFVKGGATVEGFGFSVFKLSASV